MIFNIKKKQNFILKKKKKSRKKISNKENLWPLKIIFLLLIFIKFISKSVSNETKIFCGVLALIGRSIIWNSNRKRYQKNLGYCLILNFCG